MHVTWSNWESRSEGFGVWLELLTDLWSTLLLPLHWHHVYHQYMRSLYTDTGFFFFFYKIKSIFSVPNPLSEFPCIIFSLIWKDIGVSCWVFLFGYQFLRLTQVRLLQRANQTLEFFWAWKATVTTLVCAFLLRGLLWYENTYNGLLELDVEWIKNTVNWNLLIKMS